MDRVFKDGLEHPITNTDHPGYYAEDYRAEEGTSLYAPTINGVEIEWKTRLYIEEQKGQVLKLEHNGENMYEVVIGHVSEYKVGHDERVRSGDLIALSGGKVDAEYPVGVTTGPHVHVETLINNLHTKPFYDEVIYYESPPLGEVLESLACDDLKDKAGMIKSLGQIYRIKPEVVVAIMQADTSLGKNLKTPYNYGNVGNTDGGATWTPQDEYKGRIYEGVEAIFKTLNNQYLGDYTMIGELSNGGRSILGLSACGKCYATSESSWNLNVVAMLQTIQTDLNINETFNFRF